MGNLECPNLELGIGHGALGIGHGECPNLEFRMPEFRI